MHLNASINQRLLLMCANSQNRWRIFVAVHMNRCTAHSRAHVAVLWRAWQPRALSNRQHCARWTGRGHRYSRQCRAASHCVFSSALHAIETSVRWRFGLHAAEKSVNVSSQPSTSTVTPRGELFTQPVRCSSCARRYTKGRKPTPCTTPRMISCMRIQPTLTSPARCPGLASRGC
jgi:hypothetical protein